MNKILIVTIILAILAVSLIVWKSTNTKTETTITENPVVEEQIYDAIDEELEDAIANITDEDLENMLLNQIG